jgi:A/G-specific adenine glycosylase
MADVHAWTAAGLASVRRKALKWFSKHGRELPWRETDDPYAIWVSEIMLQQTQVATVIPFYHRFLNSFPNVVSLADATIDEVYRHWAGLGYYRRARQMHEAATVVKLTYQGVFPMDFASVLALPGIGRYTAGAILSFSSDQRLPIVEANTQRLYARLLNLREELASKEGQSQLWSFAERVLPKRSGSGAINQALMEIGSQICLPKNPLCLVCPIQSQCPAFASGSQSTIPVPKKPKQITELREAALVIHDDQGRILMRRCGPEERWAGLWDFPRFDVSDCKSIKSERISAATQFKERFGPTVLIGNSFQELKHSVTRYRITLCAYEAALEDSNRRAWKQHTEIQWLKPNEHCELALNSSAKRLWSRTLLRSG